MRKLSPVVARGVIFLPKRPFKKSPKTIKINFEISSKFQGNDGLNHDFYLYQCIFSFNLHRYFHCLIDVLSHNCLIDVLSQNIDKG